MGRRTRIALKAGIWAVGLAPVACLLWWAWHDDLTANPIDFVTRTLGVWTLRFLLAALALTPIRLVCGVSWPILIRRLVGLFAFFYVALHFAVWLVLDHFFDWPTMAADVLKRPFITAGMGALILLIPLAATSTSGMVKRLGGRAWRRLHRLVYAAAVLGVLHFVWLAKVGRREPYVYGAILGVLLAVRVGDAIRRRLVARRLASEPRGATAARGA